MAGWGWGEWQSIYFSTTNIPSHEDSGTHLSQLGLTSRVGHLFRRWVTAIQKK